MSKKHFLVLTFALAGLAACGNDNYASPTASPTPVPTATVATIEATYKATPLPGVTINMYASTIDEASQTPNPSASATAAPQPLPTGPILQSQVTGSDGTATFINLTPAATYCWTFTYTSGSATLSAFNCTDGWGDTTIVIGT